MNSSSARKFGMLTGKRRSFIKGLMHNLIMEGKIKTTEARAKEIKPKVEKLVTLAKKNNVASLRLLITRLPNRVSAYKLFHEIAPRYTERRGGYLRILKTSSVRKRDAAREAIIEFI